MTYQETLDYLYSQLPMYQRVGAVAYKSDLKNTLALCEALGNPQHRFKSVHIAGTNGKGSSSHMLAAVLQSAGYKTGLYTSPHLKSFTERIRINGQEIEAQFVVDFVEEMKETLEEVKPSFFEMTVAMAFKAFAEAEVDIAVIEVGLGGRLDSTNVIQPLVSLITNISYDHQNLLGNTLVEIAGEKAGIIKSHTPVVISEYQEEVAQVFQKKAAECEAPLYFARDFYQVHQTDRSLGASHFAMERKADGAKLHFTLDLLGAYQEKNILGVLKVVELLAGLGFPVKEEALQEGLAHCTQISGLKGRWQVIQQAPWLVADTGHNEGGIRTIVQQLGEYAYEKLYMVIGMVNDKKLDQVLALLPKEAHYIFCTAKIPRALPAKELAQLAATFGLQGEVVDDVNAAVAYAQQVANTKDFIFVGGSTFVVAELDDL
ncbi:folylpolyglutamate synthase/dihydrofolate synthase family protein [Cytophagales bacterium LB-30]|uniref:Dihydrofolate synthase/folylpolyglutamate synthase n=1 Tax=Shiella aurantiaca TaxID=3058365 RepID=A0ABT8F189_9BACT|nr:folylpolyglutamate synthase/dihydrofolate synthase family protein [Shiella aurantiaca]MDN4164058.1 folylpolyglutamate synthase/dihydrofolate synthase family protein [Shiella aurantiaca]